MPTQQVSSIRTAANVLIAMAVVATLALVAVPAQIARATYPGLNGRIAYGTFDPATGVSRRYTANPDGSQVRQLTGVAGASQSSPNWSPDGRRIAVDFVDANGFVQIATAAPDGSDLQVVTSGPFIHENPDWSPNGTQIVFGYSAVEPGMPGFSTHVWVMNVDGTNAHPLMAAALSGFDVEPRWQPGGSLITFVRIRKANNGLQQEAVYVVNADGTAPRQLTSWGLAAEHPIWSPDGQAIIFNDAAFKQIPNETIWTMQPDGTDRHVLYQGTHHTGGVKPQFSPDGSKILFVCVTYGRALNEDLCTMNVDGTRVVNITNTPGIFENVPSWGTAPLQ
jgi:Tol biopolymer transport system component